ncbi:hypothetical protein CTAYLR_000221 [Chrysophaeum taylorii]|uniref:Sugar phosphate transporter domain-containing protein n=1 Tax=Chrysophaeum taylorii TaxID=2483200 RepID=A0AAD7XPM5_9STRA|nr:hypothetical protein CTAYLR_000221 [Chrysophaeum taylorii]
MALQWGIGSITWKGDWRLSLVGLVLISVILTTYACEMYLDCGDRDDKKKSEGEEDKVGLLADEDPPQKSSEGTRIKRSARAPVSNVYAFFSGMAVLLCSVSLVYTNAWVLKSFPHVATYITIQQFMCFVLAVVLVKGLHVVETIEVPWRVYLTRVAPLGACFTAYLWGSNTAYEYLQPGLIQMIKPIGSCFVFAHACAFGVERYSRAKALNFVLISCGTFLTAAPELLRGVGGVDGSSTPQIIWGVCVLVAAYFCDAYYVVSIQRLIEGEVLERAFDPLSTLMYLAPIVCACLSVVALSTERTAAADFGNIPPALFGLASVLAFGFNLSVMNFIGRLSATTYVVFDYLKDLIILSVAFFLFSERFARNELIGYAVVIVGGAVWQHRKLRLLKHAQHHLNAATRDRAPKTAAVAPLPSGANKDRGVVHAPDDAPAGISHRDPASPHSPSTSSSPQDTVDL